MTFESVAGAIFSQDLRQIVLIKRRDVPVWVLPGGGIEPGEEAESAIVREILEETGFHVKVESLSGSYEPINRLAKPTLLYRCLILGGTPRESSETKEVRFFALDSLPPMPPPYPEWVEDAERLGPTIHRRLDSVNYQTFIKYLLLHPLLVFRFLMSRFGIHWNSK